jgi:hypothetical protein
VKGVRQEEGREEKGRRASTSTRSRESSASDV